MTNDDRLKAALKMIQVTPENYKKLDTKMVRYLYEVVAEAEKNLGFTTSAYDGLTEGQMIKGMGG